MTELPVTSKRQRFVRLATARTNAVLKKLDILGNCSNKQVYEYSKDDLEKIFNAIQKKIKDTRERFSDKQETQFKL